MLTRAKCHAIERTPATLTDGIAAAQQRAYFDKPLLIAELERLEAENERMN